MMMEHQQPSMAGAAANGSLQADSFSEDRSLAVVRALVTSYQNFYRYSSRHIRSLGLAPSEFDVIATLGNTEGLQLKDLAERTLIAKSALTGIVDRLAVKGLVERLPCPADRRATRAALTRRGEHCFAEIFPVHVEHLRSALGQLTTVQQNQLIKLLDQATRSFRD